MPDKSQTAEGGSRSVVARIIAALSRQAAAARDRSNVLSAAWDKALRHAAVPFKGLELLPRQIDVHEHIALTAALETLPETGLIAVLEERDGALFVAEV